MTINKTIIRELENIYKKSIPDDLKKYLLAKYEQEPFPYEFNEQDLYANIERDIRDYEADELDVIVKSSSERWLEERGICKICILKNPVWYMILKIMLPNWNIYFWNTIWNLLGCQSGGKFNFNRTTKVDKGSRQFIRLI